MDVDLREKIIDKSLEALQDIDGDFSVANDERMKLIEQIDMESEQILQFADILVQFTDRKARSHQDHETFNFFYDAMAEFADDRDINEFDSLGELFFEFREFIKGKIHEEIKMVCQEQGIERARELFEVSNDDLKQMGIDPDSLVDFDEVLHDWGDND